MAGRVDRVARRVVVVARRVARVAASAAAAGSVGVIAGRVVAVRTRSITRVPRRVVVMAWRVARAAGITLAAAVARVARTTLVVSWMPAGSVAGRAGRGAVGPSGTAVTAGVARARDPGARDSAVTRVALTFVPRAVAGSSGRLTVSKSIPVSVLWRAAHRPTTERALDTLGALSHRHRQQAGDQA
jgi:hypothetical protein